MTVGKRARQRGQATTEVVLLLPLFVFFLYAFAKIFAVLVLVQKMEVASYYAARRYQLESHRNVAYEGFDKGALVNSILGNVKDYLGCNNREQAAFLGIQCSEIHLDVTPTQVWQIVNLNMPWPEIHTPFLRFKSSNRMEVVKYVPNRDRPIAFVLPGLKDKDQ